MNGKRRKKGQFKVMPNEILQAVMHRLAMDPIIKDASPNFGAGFLSCLQWISSGDIGFQLFVENKTDEGKVGHANFRWGKESAAIAIAMALGFADMLPATEQNMDFAQGFYHASARAVEEFSVALFEKALMEGN